MSFSNFSGGLINSIVAGAGNNISTGLANQFSSNIQFSVGEVLAGAVTDTTGFALNQGQNYLLNQVSSLVSPSIGNGLANAVVTQVASVGITAATSFVNSTVSNLLSGQPIFSGVGSAFGSGAAGSGASGGGAGGFIGLHAQGLPNAEYGENRFTTNDIVFSVVPTNAGPQTQGQPGASPTVPLSAAFSPDFSFSPAVLGNFKKELAFAGPATGSSFSAATPNFLEGRSASSSSFNPPLPVAW
jgi:hypothetical protein